MKPKLRTLLVSLGGAAILGGLIYVATTEEPVPVDLTEVARGEMMRTVNADGRTRIREVYEVSAPFTGTARRSPVEVGDKVVAGETVVAVVEPVAPALLDTRSRLQAEAALREAEAALHVAETRLHQAEEELAYAQSQFDRTKTLVERGVASTSRLEDATQVLDLREASRDAAQSGLEMAEGSVERARAALVEPGSETNGSETCCVELTAPIDGTVLSVTEISERPVQAGARLVSIGRLDDLEIVADLLSSDAVRLNPGARAIVDRWGGDDPLEARLRSVDPVAVTKVSALGIEEQRVNAVFDFVSPPEDRVALGDGFAVFLRVVEWSAEDTVKIPLSALFRHGEDWAVFIDGNGVARRITVKIGQRNGSHAQVLSGLEPGQRVITHPSDLISDGTEIVQRSEM
ncbi:MAG: HlyD family efflux transporter periplasmic adaptor subunit [Rhodobacteraceae bacterium]|nr:HlyD family efflux transporter periplasmic adaptor subunit [Paracoccaceae bacterium]